MMSLSKAAISKHINDIESLLDITLIKRTTRNVSITEAGLVYYEKVHDLLNLLASADEEVQQYEAKTAGYIKISIPVSLGLLFITPIIPDFRHQYPDIMLEVILTDDPVDILKDQFDLGIRGAGKMPDSHLKSRKIGQFHHILCATPEYLKSYGTPLAPCDLSEQEVLIYTGVASPFKWKFIDTSSQKVSIVQVSSKYCSNNSLALKQAALCHQGLLKVPNIYVLEELKSGALVRVLNDYAIEPTDIWVLYPDSHMLPHRVRVFIDFLVENFNTRTW